MKRDGYLINIGRGAIVDLADLAAALEAKEIAGAALDVFETEPLPADHPLWRLENVILTPHVAGYSPHIAERHLACCWTTCGASRPANRCGMSSTRRSGFDNIDEPEASATG